MRRSGFVCTRNLCTFLAAPTTRLTPLILRRPVAETAICRARKNGMATCLLRTPPSTDSLLFLRILQAREFRGTVDAALGIKCTGTRTSQPHGYLHALYHSNCVSIGRRKRSAMESIHSLRSVSVPCTSYRDAYGSRRCYGKNVSCK